MSLSFIWPLWEAPKHVRVAATTRAGGVSKPPYDALNLGLHVGDELTDVQANRKMVADALAIPNSPSWLRQVHGTKLVRHSQSDAKRTDEADGVWTDQEGVVLAVLTADCLPIVLCNKAGTRVAVLHAGWRGLAQGIVSAALQVFAQEDDLMAWLGPAIGPQAFEVGGEVRAEFIQRDASHSTAFQAATQPGKYFADIYQLARQELVLGGVKVFGGDFCTVTDSRFYSHRRDGVRSGRLATYAWLEGSEGGR